MIRKEVVEVIKPNILYGFLQIHIIIYSSVFRGIDVHSYRVGLFSCNSGYVITCRKQILYCSYVNTEYGCLFCAYYFWKIKCGFIHILMRLF